MWSFVAFFGLKSADLKLLSFEKNPFIHPPVRNRLWTVQLKEISHGMCLWWTLQKAVSLAHTPRHQNARNTAKHGETLSGVDLLCPQKSDRSWKLHCILWKVSTKPSEAPPSEQPEPPDKSGIADGGCPLEQPAVIPTSSQDPINILVGDFHLHLTSGWLPHQRAGGWSCSRLGGLSLPLGHCNA